MRVLSRVLIACSMLSTVFGATSISAQDQVAAQKFLQSIYTRYGKGGPGVNTDGSRARLYFSSSLISLLRADQKAVGPDEVGVLDGDPICGCQDWDAIHNLKIALTPGEPGRLKAAVSFALFGSDAKPEQSLRSLEMTLVAHAGQWRIDNIVDKSDPKAPFDLRAELTKEIRQMKQRVSTTPLPRQTAPRY